MANENMEDHKGWHLEKNVSIGHIITTVLAIISIVTWLTTMDKRIAILETNVSTITTNERDSLSRIDASLIRIETKMDDKADKGDIKHDRR